MLHYGRVKYNERGLCVGRFPMGFRSLRWDDVSSVEGAPALIWSWDVWGFFFLLSAGLFCCEPEAVVPRVRVHGRAGELLAIRTTLNCHRALARMLREYLPAEVAKRCEARIKEIERDDESLEPVDWERELGAVLTCAQADEPSGATAGHVVFLPNKGRVWRELTRLIATPLAFVAVYVGCVFVCRSQGSEMGLYCVGVTGLLTAMLWASTGIPCLYGVWRQRGVASHICVDADKIVRIVPGVGVARARWSHFRLPDPDGVLTKAPGNAVGTLSLIHI